jgi:transcriptional regulator of acetoin/glycerol metabolism
MLEEKIRARVKAFLRNGHDKLDEEKLLDDLCQLIARDFFPRTIAELEADAIVKMVNYCRGRRLKAAKLLGIGKTTLYRKIREYRLQDKLVSQRNPVVRGQE